LKYFEFYVSKFGFCQHWFVRISNACISHITQYWNLVRGIQSSSCPEHHQTLHALGIFIKSKVCDHHQRHPERKIL